MILYRRISEDFDEWAALARRDPVRFEALRSALIETAIGQARDDRQGRLRGLQWRIDQVRARSLNPVAACLSLQRMMWDAVAGDNGLMDALNGCAGEGLPTADVRPFKPRPPRA